MKSFSSYFVKEEPQVEPPPKIKFLIYCGSLKKQSAQSNSRRIALIVQKKLEELDCVVDLVVASELRYEPGVNLNTQDDKEDDMTTVLKKIVDEYDGLIVATPIWWGVYSSYVQGLFERMTNIDDDYIKSDKSKIYGKVFGGIISGSEDGYQQIQGLMSNFATELGFTIPPEGYVASFLQTKKEMEADDELKSNIDIFTRNQVNMVRALKQANFYETQQATKKYGELAT